jgi:hypothetical protein
MTIVEVNFNNYWSTIKFEDFTVYWGAWRAICDGNPLPLMSDVDFNFSKKLTCKRVGDTCYLSDGQVKSVDILIIIRTVLGMHRSYNRSKHYMYVRQNVYTAEFDKGEVISSTIIDKNSSMVLERHYRWTYNKWHNYYKSENISE